MNPMAGKTGAMSRKTVNRDVLHRNVMHPKTKQARCMRRGFSAAAGLLLLVGLLLPVPWGEAPRAAATQFEQRDIEAQALEAFRGILGLWQEELYFELYDHGMASSKARISREAFAQRMVELSWVPQGELNPKFLKMRFRFRTVVYVSARLRYQHKFNPQETFSKDHTFVLLEESGSWRIDLIRLIRAPFS